MTAAHRVAKAIYEAGIESTNGATWDTFPATKGELEVAEAAIEAMNGWQDISTAPKDGTRFLSLTTGEVKETYFLDNSKCPSPWAGFKPVDQGYPINRFNPTRWRPLPPPPESEE